MADPSRLILVDGSALAYRSFFAFLRNPLMTSRGENTSAVFGFTRALMDLLRKDDAELVAVVFDLKAPTFRHEVYPEYKSTRAKMPDELGESLPYIYELVDALGVARIAIEGIEADDVIGTLTREMSEAGNAVEILSADKDFCQLVTDTVNVLRPRTGEEPERLDVKGVEERMGVPPERVIDLLALMGDASDNIPGVPGVGEKTARKLLDQFGSLDSILEHAGEVKGKLGERLRDHRDAALLSRELVTIRTDEPIDVDPDALKRGEPDTSRLFTLFKRLEFTKLAEEFSVGEVEKVETSYTAVGSVEELEALMPRLRDTDALAFDTETTSLNALDAEIIGLSFSPAEGEAYYVPLGHMTATEGTSRNLPLGAVLEVVTPILIDPDVPKIGQHTKYDASVMLNNGIAIRGIDFDTMLAAYLIDPSMGRYGLDALSMQELEHKMIGYTDVVGTGRDKREIWQVEVDRVAPYACEDADIVLRLRNLYAPRLKELRLQHLFEEVEMPLSEVLMHMERRGILIDRPLFAELSRELSSQLHALEREIHGLAGHEFNLLSPQQLRRVLFDELALPVGKKTKTGASTDSDVLEKLMDKHPIVAKILEYRQIAKLLSTYVDALPKLVREDTGRLHTSYNQTVAATGRLSSSDPNLQNIPIRTSLGRRIREGFIAPEGWKLLSADYSQVELRILASITGDPGLVEAFRSGLDVHRHTAAAVFDVAMDEVTPDQRARSKAVNFGVIYGQGSRGLAQALKITTAEASAFIAAYFERYAAVQSFRTDTVEQARRDGYVSTLLGRRRYLPDITSSNGQRRSYAERTAVNTVIQGSAADLIKVAMVRIARRLETAKLKSHMLLQVHDELVFEVPEDEHTEVEAMVREEMEGALELEVPIVVDTGWGNNWLEAH